MIKIEAKPLEVQAELPGYGIFYLRYLGAGAEADLREKLDTAKRHIDEIAEQYKELTDKESEYVSTKNDIKLQELRASEEYKEAEKAQKIAQKELQEAINYSNKCQLDLWRSDDPAAKERLLQDFTMEQIRGFYAQVMNDAEKQENA